MNAPLEQIATAASVHSSCRCCTNRRGRPVVTTMRTPDRVAAPSICMVRCESVPSLRNNVPSRSQATTSGGSGWFTGGTGMCLRLITTDGEGDGAVLSSPTLSLSAQVTSSGTEQMI